MSRFVSAALLAVAFGGPLSAQAKKPTADEQKFIGVWEGPYQSDQAPPGGLRLTIARDSVWKVAMEVISDQVLPAGDITEFKREGNTISWMQEIAGLICKAQATFTDGTLRGESNCDGGGNLIVATWVLLRK
jgi:hypothetical protein